MSVTEYIVFRGFIVFYFEIKYEIDLTNSRQTALASRGVTFSFLYSFPLFSVPFYVVRVKSGLIKSNQIVMQMNILEGEEHWTCSLKSCIFFAFDLVVRPLDWPGDNEQTIVSLG